VTSVQTNQVASILPFHLHDQQTYEQTWNYINYGIQSSNTVF